MINSFLQNKISKVLDTITSREYRTYIIRQALFLNDLGIDNEKDLLKFHYVVQYIPGITKKITGNYNKKTCAEISNEIFANFKNIKSYDDLKNIIFNYFKSNITKVAYPIDMGDNQQILKYDVNKWRSAINDIHMRSKIFGNKKDAVDFVTKDWRDMDEKLAFERWLKFYEQKGHLKYKLAQHITTDNISLPMKLQYIPGLSKEEPRIERANERDYELDERNKFILQNTKGKLLGRIDSAIKILHSNIGMDFAGKDYSKLVDTLLSLKGDIMKIKSSLMIDDLIFRAGTSLNNSSSNVKELFIKIAQLPELPTSPEVATADSGQEGKKEEPKASSDGNKAITEFVQNSVSNVFKSIKEDYKDNLIELEDKQKFAWYQTNTPEFLYFKKIANQLSSLIKSAKNLKNITITAQEAVPATPVAPKVEVPITQPEAQVEVPVEEKEPLKTLEEKLEESTKGKPDKENPSLDVSDSIDEAFDNIKLTDVIKNLQALSRVFKNREIARQLSIIDLMLNKLGISGFFPALAEATRSALESNQYCQTRVDEILSKLISATDNEGLSEFDQTPEKQEVRKNKNMIDAEMKEYLEEPKKIETKPEIKEPVPVAQQIPAKTI